jgi:hypothetical protein
MEVRTERRWWRGPASPTGRRRRRGRAAYSSRAGRLTRTPSISTKIILLFSVADPDPYVFGPPGSRSDSGGGINLFRNILAYVYIGSCENIHFFLAGNFISVGGIGSCVPCWVEM